MKEKQIEQTTKIVGMLMKLDEKSLLLIENSAETLKKYQDLKKAEDGAAT